MHYQFSLVTADSTGTAIDFQQTMVNMNLCANDVNRRFYQVPLMCHIAHNVGLMSTRVWPHAMTLSSQNGSPIQFSDSMFRTESMIQSLRDYQICHSVPRLRLR